MKKGQVSQTGFRRIRRDSGYERRLRGTAAVLGLLAFVPAAVQLYHLMVVRYDTYSTLALRNQSRSTAVAAARGTIYDRNMNAMAVSQTVETVYINPRELKQSRADIPAMAQAIGAILGVPPEKIETLAADSTKRYHRIAEGVLEETAAQIRQYINAIDLRGVHLEPGSQRIYPYGTLAAQVIGFTNSSNTGCEGVEASYDAFLSAGTGKVVTTKGNNEMDMPFSVERYLAEHAGADVILTLDTAVQTCLEERMTQACQAYDVQNGAFGMVMDVTTGEILAMATLGSYDPNAYLEIADASTARELEQLRQEYLAFQADTESYTEKKKAYQEALTQARLKQWRNRCVSDGYEPGSTFKTITLAAAIDCGAVSLTDQFGCSGSEKITGRAQLLHCWRAKGHGSQTTAQALQNSCNLAFAHIGLRLGGERFYDYVKQFGIMEKTGIDLAGEASGVFFSKERITDTERWGTASLTSGAFGQTFKVTPLQLVRAIAAVVNGGFLLEPYLVSEVIDAQGNTILRQEPTVLRQVIRKETSETMCALIESVVTQGTAKNATVAGYRIGGKTGTSEKIDIFDDNGQRVQDKIVSFVGIAPMDNPRYIILVALDSPSRQTGIYISGGVMAAPTVGAVLSDILPYLGVEKAYSADSPAPEPVIMPDLMGKTPQQAKQLLLDSGLEPVLFGQEPQVTDQLPLPGQSVSRGSQVMVYCGDSQGQDLCVVPSFFGMTQEQAVQRAGELGLYIRFAGNPEKEQSLYVSLQEPAAGTQVKKGSSITLTLIDTKVRDAH